MRSAVPQQRARLMGLVQLAPRKPNSARRKAAWVYIYNRRQYIKITGGGSLAKFAIILMCGGGYRDTPRVKYRVIRGALECPSLRRRRRRFKFGYLLGSIDFFIFILSIFLIILASSYPQLLTYIIAGEAGWITLYALSVAISLEHDTLVLFIWSFFILCLAAAESAISLSSLLLNTQIVQRN